MRARPLRPQEAAARAHSPWETSVGRGESAEAQRLIETSQGLVRSIAWKIHQKLPPHVDLDDLIAFGQLGLIEAAREYDPAKAKFTTYAYYRIRGAVLDGLSKMGWFSRHHYHASRYEHMSNELLGLDGGVENDPDGLEDGARWLKGVTTSLAVVHLMSPRDDGGDHDVPDNNATSPQAEAMKSELRERLFDLVDALPSDASRLIRACYVEGVTLQEAAKRLGISKAWASRLHARTLQRLAHSLRLLGATDC